MNICLWVISWVLSQTVSHFRPCLGAVIAISHLKELRPGNAETYLGSLGELTLIQGGQGSSPVQFSAPWQDVGLRPEVAAALSLGASVSPIVEQPWTPYLSSRSLGGHFLGGTEGRLT